MTQNESPQPLPEPFTHTFNGITHDVYRFGTGTGAPIILMHEITGMTPALLALAQRIACSHFTVYAPHFFGPIGKRDEFSGLLFCLRHEMNCWAANKPSALAPWLRELSRYASRECGDIGVGVIGLCLERALYAEAAKLSQWSLTIREKALGPDHPEVATSLNNLALLYDNQGKYAEAEPLYEHSLAIREKILGPDHLEVANSLNNLASLYTSQGRYA